MAEILGSTAKQRIWVDKMENAVRGSGSQS